MVYPRLLVEPESKILETSEVYTRTCLPRDLFQRLSKSESDLT